MGYYTSPGHNSSNTISVANNEWDDVIKWVYDNWEYIVGVSFLPKYDPTEDPTGFVYPQMPYEVCSEVDYELYADKLNIFNITEDELILKISAIENKGYTETELDKDCSTGSCPIR